jgi:hypothetical protein
MVGKRPALPGNLGGLVGQPGQVQEASANHLCTGRTACAWQETLADITASAAPPPEGSSACPGKHVLPGDIGHDANAPFI